MPCKLREFFAREIILSSTDNSQEKTIIVWMTIQEPSVITKDRFVYAAIPRQLPKSCMLRLSPQSGNAPHDVLNILLPQHVIKPAEFLTEDSVEVAEDPA